MTVDRAIKVLKAHLDGSGEFFVVMEHDEAIALAIKGLLVLRSANSLFAGSDALVVAKERKVEPVTDSETIGERIKKARKEMKLTQRQLAEILGVSGAMVAQYETGARKPKYETVAKFADALGFSTAWLLGGVAND